MDIAFNQTEVHMSDPAMHNTEVRPDAWKEGREQQQSAAEGESGKEGEGDKDIESAQQPASIQVESGTYQEPAAAQGVDQSSIQSNEASYEANNQLSTELASDEQSLLDAQPNVDPAVSSVVSQADIPAQSTEVTQEQLQESSAPIDFQALLASLKTAPSNATPNSNVPEGPPGLETSQAQASTASGGTAASPVTASSFGPAPGAGLPSRPPPQEQPLIHPNYVHSQHIRDYHPHAAHPAFQPQARANGTGNTAEPSSRQFVPAVAIQGPQNGQTYSAAPVQAPAASVSPAQQTTQHSRNSSGTPLESRRERNITAGEPIREEDMKWTQETQRKFDQFIGEERAYVAEGRWEQFPPGSRLFVGMYMNVVDRQGSYTNDCSGNLPSERVTKRDIFHVFHHYGGLAQISIKQAYGFVQYLRKEDCQRALDVEQGRQIRDKRIRE